MRRSIGINGFSLSSQILLKGDASHYLKTGPVWSLKNVSVNYSLKHLSRGSSEPPIQPGKLRLYGMRFCPFDHRVHLVMGAKNIPHDKVYINLGNKPDWYLTRIPTSKVPGLVVDNHNLYESLFIADYLDEKYPDPPLHSKDALQKAKDRIVIDNFKMVTFAFYKLVWIPSPLKEDFDTFLAEHVLFDKELADRGTKFFGGNVPGMVDYMIWPWYERIGTTKLIFGDEFEFPLSKFKHLASWVAEMEGVKAVKDYYLSPEIHAKYLISYRNRAPDFDMLL